MIVLLSDKKLSWHTPFIQGAHYEAAPTRGLTVPVCSACYTVMERLPEAAFGHLNGSCSLQSCLCSKYPGTVRAIFWVCGRKKL